MGLLSIIPIVGEILDKVVADPDKKLELKLELAKLADQEAARESQERIAQTEVNKVESGHRSIFVAGWRPFVGWGCGSALIYNTMIAPMFGLGVADLGFLQTILLGMLGISVSRTVEKIKGVTNDVLPIIKPKNETLPSVPEKEKKGGILKKVGRGEWPF